MKIDKTEESILYILTKSRGKTKLPQHTYNNTPQWECQQRNCDNTQNCHFTYKKSVEFIQNSILKWEENMISYTYKEVIPMIS